MMLDFVSNPDSPFYRSQTFGHILDFATTHDHRCRLDEHKGHRRMTVADVPSVDCALVTLRRMLEEGEEKSQAIGK